MRYFALQLFALQLCCASKLTAKLGSGSYAVQLDGEEIMTGKTFATFCEGKWYSASPSKTIASEPLLLKSTTEVKGNDWQLGNYTATVLEWMAGNTVFETRLLEYPEHDNMLVFEYAYPGGAKGTNHSITGLVANFPAMDRVNLPGALSWEGEFVGAHEGRTFGFAGGPTVFYSNDTSKVVVAAPLQHFKPTSESDKLWSGEAAAWVPGLGGTVESVPAGFVHSFVLFAKRLPPTEPSQPAITETMYEWGKMMQARYKTRRIADITVEKLSYQTDNGAQYCFCSEGCDTKLLSMESYLKSIDVPVAWLSFQGGWWNNKNIHTPNCAPWCVTSWDVNKTKVPMGLSKFQSALDMPLQLYAPYFCADTIYARANGGKWDFIASDTSLPGTVHPFMIQYTLS
jgi:hypothetical protein